MQVKDVDLPFEEVKKITTKEKSSSTSMEVEDQREIRDLDLVEVEEEDDDVVSVLKDIASLNSMDVEDLDLEEDQITISDLMSKRGLMDFLSSDKAKAGVSVSKEYTSSTTMEVEKSDLPLTEDQLNKLCKEASRSFFSEYGLISHQINSFNDFVDTGIHKLFDSIGEIDVKPGEDPSKKEGEGGLSRSATIKFGNVKLEKPMFWTSEKAVVGKKHMKLLPRHARLQHMNYSSRITAEVEFQVYTLKSKRSDKFKTGKEQQIVKKITCESKTDVFIGRIPVMVRSNLCWMNGHEKGDCEFDHGGYFLINGAEKIFIAQEQICLKRLWVSDQPNWNVSYRAGSKRLKIDIEELSPQGKKVLNVHYMSCTIPLWIFLFSLDMSSDKEICGMIDINMSDTSSVDLLVSTITYADEHYEGFRGRGCAPKIIDDMISKTKYPLKESIKDFMAKHLFTSLTSLKQKGVYVVYMLRCLLQSHSGERKCENRDDFKNKRLDLAGELLERELQIHIKHLERRMVKSVQRDLDENGDLHQIDYYLDDSIITNGLSRAFSTGAWCHQFKKTARVSGVVTTLRRTNTLQIMADMRKTQHQVRYSGKLGGARFPHPSHRGKLCFLSTPDGVNCGLVKNIAVTGLVSTNAMEPLLDKLLECGMEKILEIPSHMSLKGKDKVFLNGEWVGVCGDSLSFVLAIRSKRRTKEVPSMVEVKRDQVQGEVRIFSDSGRILRPLLVVGNLKNIKLCKGGYNINSLLREGIIELVGIEEEEDCRTAYGVKWLLLGDEEYTHCELDTSFMLGLSCGIIPFPNHDHVKRVLYQSQKHSQQAIGYSTTNPNIRVDTLSHQLYYPQRPLFHTMISDCLGIPEYRLGPNVHPKPEIYNGQNAIVAINVHHGYNQEDSLVMNRSSLERGMFRTEHIRNYKTEVYNLETKRLRTKDKILFGKMQSKLGRVHKLDDDGFPFIGASLRSGDIVIGKRSESGVDHSVKLKDTEEGQVQKVILSANDEGKNFAAVSLTQVRSPCVGDKFSSMHGQKGVVGFLDSQENFPFTCQGIVPDIVINPHAFPSRQTVGQLLESALGKGIACGGTTRHATPFTTPSVDIITEQLQRVGYSRWGHERVCSGEKGEMMKSLIFIGPTFYQRLTKMAVDEVKVRSSGPVHPYTRQPVKDRKRRGGVKFGEMERDCLLAFSPAAFLHERLLTLSDPSQMLVCSKCSNMSIIVQTQLPGGSKGHVHFCRFCESSDNIVKVDMPYGAKLLCHELFSMGISVNFGTEPC